MAGVSLHSQLQSNEIGTEANALSRQSNAIAKESYLFQLWDICHDQPVSLKFGALRVEVLAYDFLRKWATP